LAVGVFALRPLAPLTVAMRDKYGRWISFRPLISPGGLD
jgi:hypothetical protein